MLALGKLKQEDHYKFKANETLLQTTKHYTKQNLQEDVKKKSLWYGIFIVNVKHGFFFHFKMNIINDYIITDYIINDHIVCIT